MNIFKLSNKELEEYLKNNIDIKGPNELLQELIECGLRGEKMEELDKKIEEDMKLLFEYNKKTYRRNEIKKSVAQLVGIVVLFIFTIALLIMENRTWFIVFDIISLTAHIILMVLYAVDIEKDLDKLAEIPELPEHLKFGTLSKKERNKYLQRFK